MDYKVDTCLGCGKLIRYTKFNLCDQCRTKYLTMIKDYLGDNKNANNIDIARSLGINMRIVNHFIQEEDLVDTSSKISEEQAKKLTLAKSLGNQFNQNKPSNGGMHFINSKKRF